MYETPCSSKYGNLEVELETGKKEDRSKFGFFSTLKKFIEVGCSSTFSLQH